MRPVIFVPTLGARGSSQSRILFFLTPTPPLRGRRQGGRRGIVALRCTLKWEYGKPEADDGSGVAVTLPNDVGVHRLRQFTKPAADFIQPLVYFFLISGVQRS
jgi:hypothetical protein